MTALVRATAVAGIGAIAIDRPPANALNLALVTQIRQAHEQACADGARAISPVPVIAAVTGPCPAGAAVLAIDCDDRVGAQGSFRIGLNEVAVGLPVPPSIMAAFVGLVGPRHAQRLAMRAQLIPMLEVFAVGWVDELAPPEQVTDEAQECAARLAALLPIAMNRARRLGRRHRPRGRGPCRDRLLVQRRDPGGHARAGRAAGEEIAGGLSAAAARR
jgi:enoyl-CoA hydratase/carnithine racemase